MIVTLSTVYYDNNPGSKVWKKLRILEYNLIDKTMDIYQFIRTVNSLLDKAGNAKAVCKTILFEYIPTDLHLCLLWESKNPTISSEDFTYTIDNIAEAKQYAYEKQVEKKEAYHNRNQSPTSQLMHQIFHRSLYRRDNEAKLTIDDTLPINEYKKVELKVDGKYLLCKKEGYMVYHYRRRKLLS
jgi:hypothetical protein